MSIAIGHFAVGAALTTLVVTFLAPGVTYPRTVVLAGGGWAMVPDLHQVSPVAHGVLYRFHQSAVTDVFWFHRTLDAVDAADSNTVATLLFACFIVTTLIAEYRSHRTPGVVSDVYETHLGVELDDYSDD